MHKHNEQREKESQRGWSEVKKASDWKAMHKYIKNNGKKAEEREGKEMNGSLFISTKITKKEKRKEI